VHFVCELNQDFSLQFVKYLNLAFHTKIWTVRESTRLLAGIKARPVRLLEIEIEIPHNNNPDY
jgi:hypothetical protein